MPRQTVIEGSMSPKIAKIHNAALRYDSARAAVETARDEMKMRKGKLAAVMKDAATAGDLTANEKGTFIYKHGTVRVAYGSKEDVQCKVGKADEFDAPEGSGDEE